jgi:hypothetical protein
MPLQKNLIWVASWLCLGWFWMPSQVDSAEPATPAASEQPADQKFVRLAHDAGGAITALETAIVTFQGTRPEEAGLTVDLVGAVHVGEKSYYQALNEAFTHYDAVLFEMVAPEGTRIPKGAKANGSHPVNVMQNGMKNLLGLEHQLEYIDYTKENLVHADMSPDRFSKSMEDRGENVWQIMLRIFAHGLAQQAQQSEKSKASATSELDLLLALFDDNRAQSLKRMMAEQFADVEGMAAVLDGKQGSTLISERNKVALEELTRQIAAGKKHIAIFYGAAHLPDFQRRLERDFAMRRSGERWLVAWNTADPSGAKAPGDKRDKAKRSSSKSAPAAEPAGSAPMPAAQS